MTIRVLPETIAAQIAAGEVVERPASVVKELMENALDAGASAIHVEIRQGGTSLIRVADDGVGIPHDQVEIAFRRHSTSKLHTAADLDAICTLGFRGEALASIASVSRLIIVSRTKEEEAGTRLAIEGGKVTSQDRVGAPVGTMISVQDLFYNVPARLKFLRAHSTEKRHVDAFITRYAMAYPSVSFRLVHDGKQQLQTSGSGSLHEVIAQVYGLDAARKMHPVNWEEMEEGSRIKVSGWVGDPALNRATRSYITLFLNGRWIQDRSLSFAVEQAYHSMLMTGRHPVAVVMIEMSAGDVDVNVHPTKAQVRFKDQRSVFSAVQRAVRRTLISSSDQRVISRPLESQLASSPSNHDIRPELVQDLLPGATGTSQYQPRENFALPTSVGAELGPLRVVGQVSASFLVCEDEQGMVLVDQHAAHERILYEQFLAQRERGVMRQSLLQPEMVDISPEGSILIEENLAKLQDLGFDIEHFGGYTWMVRGMPALLESSNPMRMLAAVADTLENEKEPLAEEVERRIISRVCKTSAIKAGQVLTMSEMQELVRQLESCEAPLTCPHGRPTMVRLPVEQLEKEFRRR